MALPEDRGFFDNTEGAKASFQDLGVWAWEFRVWGLRV